MSLHSLAAEAVENMEFTLSAMGSLATSRTLAFEGKEDGEDGGEGFLLATNTDAASENWAFFPSPFGRNTVERVCAFFKDLPFVWPLFPGVPCQKILEEAGMPERGALTVMTLDKSKISSKIPKNFPYIVEEITGGDVPVWAETSWQAFDSQPGAPESFTNLARGLQRRGDFILLLAKKDGLPAGTAMLSLSGDSAGVYYFATLPKERRKGAGNAMMNALLRLALERGRGLVTLQATKSGAPFYASLGFEPLFRLPLHSRSAEYSQEAD